VCRQILENYDIVSGAYGTPPSRSMGRYVRCRFLHEACAVLMHRLRVFQPRRGYSYMSREAERVHIEVILVPLVLMCAAGRSESALRYFLPALKQRRSELISDGTPLSDDLMLREVHDVLKFQACAITSTVLSEFTFSSEEADFIGRSDRQLRLLIENCTCRSAPGEVIRLIKAYMTPDARVKELSDSLLPLYLAGGKGYVAFDEPHWLRRQDEPLDEYSEAKLKEHRLLLGKRLPQWKSFLRTLLLNP